MDELWPYEVDAGDHFETSAEALADVAPLLAAAAKARDLPQAQLRVYDPYYCSGRAKKLLKGLGFHPVHRRRDFYADIAKDAVPDFHVLLTNPPYSGDHKGEAGAGAARVTLVTHGELRRLQDCEVLSRRVAFRALTKPCFVATKTEAETPDMLDLQGRRRGEWVEAISLAQDADALVCNLFAMPPVFHLAERLQVPWLCCSPCLVPYAMPPTFEEEMGKAMPELLALLRGRDGRAGPCDEFNWSAAREWLWPVFTQSHALLREELLGLGPVPGYDTHGDKDRLAPEQLRGAQLLLGLPQALLSGAGSFVPKAAKLCGHWACGSSGPEDPDLTDFLQNCRAKVETGQLSGLPIYIGFGSMGKEGLVPDAPQVTKLLLDTAKWMARPVILMPFGPVDEQQLRHDVFCCKGEVSHSWLLPQCGLAIHHGGVGTVIACLRANLPQLVLPLAFDQPFWGKTLQDLGVGDVAELEGEVRVSVPVLARKLRQLLSPEVAEAVRRVGCQVEEEDGLPTAVEEIRAMLDKAETHARSCLRPVQRIQVEGLEILGRSAGEVQFIHREIATERCYGDLEKLPPGIVIDAGLNLGLFSLVLARQWSGSQLTVLAFEPAKETYDLALQNLRHHGVRVVDHGQEVSFEHLGVDGVVVHCFQLALSDQDGEDSLCYFPYLTSSSTLARHRPAKDAAQQSGCFDPRLVHIFFAAERMERVACVRLDSVLAALDAAKGTDEAPVVLLKCDIEGSEEEALLGLGKALARVQRLAVEVHGAEVLRRLQSLPWQGEMWSHPQELIPDHFMAYGLSPGLEKDAAFAPLRERLLDFILRRQRLKAEGWCARTSPNALVEEVAEPFLLLLPSWTVGKAFFRSFLAALASLKDGQSEEDAEVFYLCRRGPKGRPEKYHFDHVQGAGLSRCPFFGLWICGGFGKDTARAMRRAQRAEGFWEPDETWYPCRVRNGEAEPVPVRWEDGTSSELPSKHLRGLLLFRDTSALQRAGLLRSPEQQQRRQELNPKQRLRAQRAREARERAQTKKRRHQYVRAEEGAGDAEHEPSPESADRPTLCRHFFSERGCSRGDKCRFSHRKLGVRAESDCDLGMATPILRPVAS
ncbi:unnamed protein product [Effrenium voratum]|uniref:C3H1-type domain-containing protein n=1 Tax=Effrenium voratum TaxID=2562239 RepID=A0AA36JKY0_9DINO|nr:unnamed protein product [Effrenium voratum]